MNPKHAPIPSNSSPIDVSASPVTPVRLSIKPLTIIRSLWLALVIPSLILFVVGLPHYYSLLLQPCTDVTSCSIVFALTAEGMRGLAALNISITGYASFCTTFWAIIVAIWGGIGLFLFWKRSDDWIVLLVAFALVMFNITYPGGSFTALSIAYPVILLPMALVSLLGQIAFNLFLLLFPSGRLAPRWTGWIIPVIILVAAELIVPPNSPLNLDNGPEWLNGIVALAMYGTIFFSQIYRYRHASTLAERQQTKWVAFGISTVVAGFIVFGLLFSVLFPVVNQPDSPLILVTLVYPLLLLVLPVSITVAIMHYRLWDIDFIISRTLLYSALTVCVIGIYVLIVGYLGAIFRTSGNLIISLVAAGVVAVAFQPLRALFQRGINRLLYGLRDEPYLVLARLGQRLETTIAPDAVLPTIVETVREALKLSYAAIELQVGSAATLATSTGTPPQSEVLRMPLIYQGEQIGTLIIGPRGRDAALTPADRQLLQDLTHEIGIAVHTVSLSNDLQRSRERLVTAREEERRRLRRDLHDGLGPMLSATLLKAGLLRTIGQRDPDAADVLISQIEAEIESAIANVRRVSYNLRPPALDELGLVSALQEYVARLSAETGDSPLRVKLVMPDTLPMLPAAVEVAAYRIVQEAVTNVIRHSQAHTCSVVFSVGDTLRIEISDDGVGFEATASSGVGLHSMRERSEELGGAFTILPIEPHGMFVQAQLPLSGDNRTASDGLARS